MQRGLRQDPPGNAVPRSRLDGWSCHGHLLYRHPASEPRRHLGLQGQRRHAGHDRDRHDQVSDPVLGWGCVLAGTMCLVSSSVAVPGDDARGLVARLREAHSLSTPHEAVLLRLGQRPADLPAEVRETLEAWPAALWAVNPISGERVVVLARETIVSDGGPLLRREFARTTTGGAPGQSTSLDLWTADSWATLPHIGAPR